jgi:flagellar assembly protein FliH
MIPRARVLPAPAGERAVPLLDPGVGTTQRRRIAREEADARVTAERIVGEARATAEAIVLEARARAATAVETAAREAQEDASAQLAARWLALREHERATLGREGDRAVGMAVVLAERLLGASLALDPSRIAELARGVLDEARGARRAVIEAHPLDADELRTRLTRDGLDLQSVEVRADAALARGELRLHTDLGTIDARLAPRFERLAAALRDALV